MSQHETRQANGQQEGPALTLTPDVSECLEFLGNWNQSLFGFYVGRVQQYWKLPFEIQPASSPEEYFQMHERFLHKMVADYAEQAEKLMEIANKELSGSRDPSEPEYAAHLLKAQQDAAKIIDQAKAQAEHILAAAEERAGETAAEPERQPMTPKRRRSA